MFKIITDSCCDSKNEKGLFLDVKKVPLYLLLGEKQYLDDENLDVKDFVDTIDTSVLTPKTQCPSPEAYMKLFDGPEDEIFVVTLTSKLSGSYNSALLAANLYLEDHPEKKIHIFDSMSASSGELVIVNQIKNLIEEGHNFNTIVQKVEYLIRNENKLYAVLENLDTLIKNGRLTKIQAIVTSLARIKLVLTAKEGEIALHAKAMTTGQATSRIIKEFLESGIDFSNKTLFISHCDAKELAETFKRKVMIKCNFKNIEIFETSGLSSVYANKGGIIISY